VEKHFHTTSRRAGRQPKLRASNTETQDTSERSYLPWSSRYWYLSDSHLLGHGSLARSTRGANAGGGTSLLLEDLPELETLIGSSSSEHLTVRAEAAVEDSALVGRDLDSSDEGRVAPDAERVVGEAA